MNEQDRAKEQEEQRKRNRAKAVELMLRDMLSYLPQPKQPSDLLSADSGLAPGSSVPCSACDKRGRVLAPGRPCVSCERRLGPKAPPVAYFANAEKELRVSTLHGCKPCLNCGGTGWKKVSVPKGKIGTDWDEYSGTRHNERLAARDTKPWEREQDTARQLRHASRTLALWEAPETVEEVWESRRKAQWQSGSYAQLTHALRYLEQNWPRRFSLVWRLYVLEEPIVLSAELEQKMAETISWLARLMPQEILVPSHIKRELDIEQKNAERKTTNWRGHSPAHARQRAERDEEIRRLRYDEGWKISRLARHFSLSEWSIKQISGATATVAA